jgi:hypothetical protein
MTQVLLACSGSSKIPLSHSQRLCQCPSMIDARICNVLVDANAYDHSDDAQRRLVERFRDLADKGLISTPIAPRGVLEETQHANTPRAIRGAMEGGLFSRQVGLNRDELARIQRLRVVLKGNGKSDQHNADAGHVFEAAKYGAYFITHDGRLKRKVRQIAEIVGPTLQIVTLAEFLTIYDRFEELRPR